MHHNMSPEALAALDVKVLRASSRKKRRRDMRTALWFMLPALLMVGGWLLYPVVYNVFISFTKWKRFKGLDQFAGAANYQKLFNHPNFELAMTNTAIWVLVSLAVPVTLGLALALLVRGVRFEEAAKNIFFLPRILAPTAIGVLWYFVYAPDGMFNAFLSLFGHNVTTGWLYDTSTVTGAIIIAYLWQTVGLAMVLMLLGLAALPRDPLEAATVDGATPRQIFRHITLALLLPTILVVIILSVLAGFTVFDHIWVMAKDYPGKRTLSLTVYMYVEAFEKGSWAYASAIAVVLGVVVLGVTWAQALLQQRLEQLRG